MVAGTVKYGIVGVGMMGREHLINLYHLRSEGVSVVAIADPHVPSQNLALDLAHSFNWPLKVLFLTHFCFKNHYFKSWVFKVFAFLLVGTDDRGLWILKVFAGHKELLDSLLCDVVVVSTPNMTHHHILMDIINHPKPHHVLVEKPLCTTVPHCKEVSPLPDSSHCMNRVGSLFLLFWVIR